eukprot:COSAG06_NODE_3504_length_5258_cov_11.424307_2_plen_206_part_00
MRSNIAHSVTECGHRLTLVVVSAARRAADATWLESSATQTQKEAARRVAQAEHRAVGAEGKLVEYIGKSAALLSGKGALSTIEDKKSQRKDEQGGLWVFIQEDGDSEPDDRRIRSPLPEVTPREIPLHIAALEEVEEGVPPDGSSGGAAGLRDYSYSYKAPAAAAAAAAAAAPAAAGSMAGTGPAVGGESSPELPGRGLEIEEAL